MRDRREKGIARAQAVDDLHRHGKDFDTIAPG
jgi:hypothetical protein